MMRDRRGFQYPLEAVRKVAEWDVLQAAQELAALNAAARQIQEDVDELNDRLTTAHAEAMARRNDSDLLDIDAQRRGHRYLTQLRHRLDLEADALGRAERQCEEAGARLKTLRKLSECLARDREDRAAEHDQACASRAYTEADDQWLLRQKCKENP